LLFFPPLLYQSSCPCIPVMLLYDSDSVRFQSVAEVIVIALRPKIYPLFCGFHNLYSVNNSSLRQDSKQNRRGFQIRTDCGCA
jgi:hypothetical protein